MQPVPAARADRTPIELLIARERRVAIAYGLEVPELIEPALVRSRAEILGADRPLAAEPSLGP